MLVTLGLDSQFAMVDVVVAGLLDEYPHIFRVGNRKTYTVLAACIIGFVLGIPILTRGGIHFFNMINDYSAWHGLLILALIFLLVIQYGYQFSTTKFRFVSDMEDMIGNLRNLRINKYKMRRW